MQSDDFIEAHRIFQNLISDENLKIDCIVLSPSLLGGLLKAPQLQGKLKTTYEDIQDPFHLPVLISDSFEKPYGIEWVEVGEDPEDSRQELLKHRIIGSLKVRRL